MGDPIEKTRRQREILDLIKTETIESQDALQAALKRRGVTTTQATLSRDLNELRVTRIPTGRGYRYAPVAADGVGPAAPYAGKELRSAAALEVTGIDANEVCVIVRTLVGRAQGVAVYIDGLGMQNILGTIAGDDTILIVPRHVKRTESVKKHLAETFGLPCT
jgi:transcriptional regulator of arginine metabolism